MFFITHCYWYEEKTCSFLTSLQKILLKWQKCVFVLEWYTIPAIHTAFVSPYPSRMPSVCTVLLFKNHTCITFPRGNGVFPTVCRRCVEKKMVAWKRCGECSDFFFCQLSEFFLHCLSEFLRPFSKIYFKMAKENELCKQRWKIRMFIGRRQLTVPHLWKMKCCSISCVNLHPILYLQKY